MSAFGGKADMTICACLLSWSLLGVKRTSFVALHMSASDPKRTANAAARCGLSAFKSPNPGLALCDRIATKLEIYGNFRRTTICAQRTPGYSAFHYESGEPYAVLVDFGSYRRFHHRADTYGIGG
jgi:hypothetical protein